MIQTPTKNTPHCYSSSSSSYSKFRIMLFAFEVIRLSPVNPKTSDSPLPLILRTLSAGVVSGVCSRSGPASASRFSSAPCTPNTSSVRTDWVFPSLISPSSSRPASSRFSPARASSRFLAPFLLLLLFARRLCRTPEAPTAARPRRDVFLFLFCS